MALTIDGTAVTVEIAPDDTVWAEAPTWEDVTDLVRTVSTVSSGRTTEIEAVQPGTLEVLMDNRDRTFDLAWGPAAVVFDGTAGNHWGCGDIAAFAGASQLDVRAAVAMDDWTPAAITAIVGQWGGAGNLSWLVRITAAGYLQLLTSSDGTASTARDSGVRVSAVDGQLMAIRVTWDNSGSGTTAYYVKRTTPERAAADCQSDDGWVALGASDTGTTTTLYNSTNAVRVGTQGSAGTASMLDGTLYYAQAATAIDGTPDVAFWPKDAGTNSAATSWVSSVSGETWTGTGSAYDLKVQGPYYGRLTPGTPVRVTATRSATDYDVWTGYLRRSPQDWPVFGLDATVRLQATDGLGWLQDTAAPSTPQGVRAGSGVGSLWPLREPLYSLQIGDERGSAPGSWSGPLAAGNPTQPGASGTTRSLVWGVNARCNGDTHMPDGAFVFYSPALGFWVDVPDTGAAFRVVAEVADHHVVFDYGVTGWFCQAWDGGGGGYDWSAQIAGRLTTGPHYVIVPADLPATGAVYVDGATHGLAVDGALSAHTFNTTGWPTLYIDGTGATVSDVVVGDLAALTALWSGDTETTGERMTALLTAAGVPAALQDVHTEPSTYCGPTGAGQTWGELCRQTAAAEWGRFHAAKNGTLTFRSRIWDWTDTTATTSQGTFGDDPAEVPYIAVPLEPADKVQILNEVTVSLPDGTAGTARNLESIAQHGPRGVNITAPVDSPAAAEALAAHIVSLRAWPRPRITSLTVNPVGTAAAWSQVLNRALGERVTVIRRPTATTEPITAAVTVERLSHVIDRAGTWVTTYLTSPAQMTAAEAGYLTLDDAVLGLLDAGLSFAP